MSSIVIEQFDINDVKSLLEDHHTQMKKEFEEIINNVSQSPIIVTREKLIEMLDCSASWLSKLTKSGELPSILIGSRVFYDIREIVAKNMVDNKNKWRVKKKV